MITIVVRDTPQPQGSKNAFALRKAGAYTGRSVVVEDNTKVKPWREAVRTEAQRVIDVAECPFPLEGPLAISVAFTLPKPQSAPKRRRVWPHKKPDLSKLLRSTEDALTSIGIYRDDAQIVVARISKDYPAETDSMSGLASPGAIIRIAPITDLTGASDGQVTAG